MIIVSEAGKFGASVVIEDGAVKVIVERLSKKAMIKNQSRGTERVY